MPRVSEEIEIRASPAVVWRVVQEELGATETWSLGRIRATTDDGGPPGPGSHIRYELQVGGGNQTLVLKNETWRPPQVCAGPVVEGPVKGSFTYTFRPSGPGTRLRYDLDLQLSGMLRFAGGMFKSQLESNLREALISLQAYIERRSPEPA